MITQKCSLVGEKQQAMYEKVTSNTFNYLIAAPSCWLWLIWGQGGHDFFVDFYYVYFFLDFYYLYFVFETKLSLKRYEFMLYGLCYC